MAEPQIKDQRGWAPVDIGYLDNPKMLDVLDASGTATLMHLASILYCAQHLTDGHLSPGIARRKVGATRDDDQLLIDAGLWHQQGHTCEDCPDPEPGKVYVHNFLEHNRTAAKVKKVSERRSEAAKARWAKERADDAPSMQSALQPAVQNGDVCNAEREKERKKDLLVNPDGPTDRITTSQSFDEWWEHWPKKVKKTEARAAFPKALKALPLPALIEATDLWVKAFEATGNDRKYMVGPEQFLKHQRWEDDLTTSAPQQPPAFDPLKDW